jgi:hypothetical protein
MVADIETIKKGLSAEACKFARLLNSEGKSYIPMNKGGIEKQRSKIIEALTSGELPDGVYFVEGKPFSAGATLFKYQYNIGSNIKPVEEMTREEEIDIKVQLEKLKAENEALRKELQEEPEEELGEETAPAYLPLAEKLITSLSEIAVPLINKYFEQRDRQIQALEAAASTATRPAAIAPAPSFQVSRTYVRPAQQASPAAGPATPTPPYVPGTVVVTPGAPGSGGVAPQEQPKIPDNITEEEYLEAVKHLTYEELQQYYQQIRKSGNKIEMQFFLAVVKEVRPDDILNLVENEPAV